MKTISINQANANAIAQEYNLSFGDIAIRTKGGFLSKHYAVFIGYGRYDGIPYFVENQKDVNIRYISLQQFLDEGSLVAIRKFEGNTNTVQQRIDEWINKGEKYSLLSNNCEHFANYVTTGFKDSKQINNAGLAVGGLGLLALLFIALR
jgi:hypothetical protein